jgi:hypothetical protein
LNNLTINNHNKPSNKIINYASALRKLSQSLTCKGTQSTRGNLMIDDDVACVL